jgi:hypothetical protein
MKKLIKILIFVLCLMLALCISASATAPQNEELKAYVGEKIMPVVAGVATSLIALLSTLKSIFKSLKDLKGERDSLGRVQSEIKDQNARDLEQIKAGYEELRVLLADVPSIKEELNSISKATQALIVSISRLSKISSLGFLQSPEVIKSGKGKEIALLAKQNQEVEDEEAS